MLTKLLKYDFRSVIHYWWPAALVSLALGIGGGLCVRVLASERNLPPSLQVLAILTLILFFVALSVFAVLSIVLVGVRVYKNFFTDQGYLTFTLPVRRSHLLLSKLILGVSMQSLTYLVVFLALALTLGIGLQEQWRLPEVEQTVSLMWTEVTAVLGAYLPLYLIEFLALMFLLVVSSQLFLQCCIALGCIITRKAKALTSIAVYYGANSVFSFLLQLFYLFGIGGLSSWILRAEITHPQPLIALILFGLILFIALFCALLYTLYYWMLDRKLNLS